MDNLLDETIRRDVQLQRFATQMVREYVTPTAQEIARNIGNFLIGYEDLSAKEKRKLIAQVNRYTSEQWRNIWVGYDSELEELLTQEGAYIQDLYQEATPEDETLIPVRGLPPANLPITTTTVAGVWAQFINDNVSDTARTVNAVVQQGIQEGATVNQMVKTLRGNYNRRTKNYENGALTGKQVKRAEALVRTGTSHHVNAVRDRFAQQNNDVIQKRIFFATLDNRTTSICLANHLKEWDIDDANYPRLPLHFNERSVYLFKTKGVNPLNETRPVQVGEAEEGNREFEQVTGKTTASGWLRKQPRWFIDETLGKKRAELFIDGGLDIKSMVDIQNRPLTLAQLSETTAGRKAMNRITNND